MNKAKVFVTQVPHKRDKETGSFVPTVNLSPAEEHGEVVIMFPARAPFFATHDLVKQLREHLREYNLERGDCLLAMGDPVVQAAAAAVLGRNGAFQVLKWDRNTGRYTASRIVV